VGADHRDLAPIVAEIQEHCEPDDYVICRQQFADPGWLGNSKPRDYPKEPTDPKTIWRIAKRVGKRAGIIAVGVGAHTMRRAFADHIYRTTGDVRLTQVLLGHADIGTTQKLPRRDHVGRDDRGRCWREFPCARNTRSNAAYGDGGNRTHVRTHSWFRAKGPYATVWPNPTSAEAFSRDS
jgi:hypothetical protein